MDVTAAYMEVDNTYLVPAGSRIHAVTEADQPGVRIAVPARSSPDLYLTRTLHHARLIREEVGDAVVGAPASREADAIAADCTTLARRAARIPGASILDGRFVAVQHAIALPRGRADALAYVNRFIEQAKHTGLVQQAIERAGLRGVRLASPA